VLRDVVEDHLPVDRRDAQQPGQSQYGTSPYSVARPFPPWVWIAASTVPKAPALVGADRGGPDLAIVRVARGYRQRAPRSTG
jgi:hypothetical protein